MKYDDAGWHSGGDFPEGQPEEHGGTHIALFLKWCLVKGWGSSVLPGDEVEQVVDGRMSASEFFFEHCDGKLVDAMLNADGNAFAERYYGDDGLYLDDYSLHFAELMYRAPESAHDFAKFSAVLDARLKSGVLIKSQLKPESGIDLSGWAAPDKAAPKPDSKPPKPWWKFW